ncbi:MAG: DNA-directed RNA polymerase subunit omega [Vallitaleaceae bacterium]|jgi:DNA-directed RNA polymerase subunit omega|nr:DNA-directed RNA polymerase subunit omega [Vallitaleaceae bacterium]
MLHPSYSDLMSRVNDRKEEADQLRSRYSIVIATAKRARQLVDGDEPLVKRLPRSLSTAVMELYEGKIDIV